MLKDFLSCGFLCWTTLLLQPSSASYSSGCILCAYTFFFYRNSGRDTLMCEASGVQKQSVMQLYTANWYFVIMLLEFIFIILCVPSNTFRTFTENSLLFCVAK